MVIQVAFDNLDTWLSQQPDNTVDTPYELDITGLTENDIGNSSTQGTLGYVLKQHTTKYVDLSHTTLPSNLVSMFGGFYGCSNLVISPDIPASVTDVRQAFYNCRFTEAPVLPEGITSLRNTFDSCIRLTQAPVIPNTVVDLFCAFIGCSSLIQAPVIPNGAYNIQGVFANCTSLRVVPNIPSSVQIISDAFRNCSSLEEINCFEADLETIVHYTGESRALNCFSNCLSLTKIYLNDNSEEEETDDWHIYSLKFEENSGTDYISGKVYDKDGTTHTIASTKIVKDNILLPILTDELWFPDTENDTEINSIIQKMISYRYGVFNKETIPPDEKTMVLWADNPANVKSNLKGMNPVNIVQAGNMNPVTSNAVVPVDEVTLNNMQSVTSNAVAESLSYSITEIKTGAKWLDGKDVYKCTLEITVNNADLQVDISSLHVDSFIIAEGTLHNDGWGAFWYPLPFISSDLKHMLQYQYANSTLYIYAKSTVGAMTGTLYASIFYTKTTD